MKNRKSWIAMLLSATLLLGLVSCAKNNSDAEIMAAIAGEGGNNVHYGTNAAMDEAEKAAYDAALNAAQEAVESANAAMDKVMEEASVAATATVAATTTALAATTGAPMISIPPEDYGKIIENPFISTADNHVSTFSADVDTASYTYFRKLMSYNWKLGEIIAKAGGAIRTEEMINYFDYDYADPIDGNLFGTKSQFGPCPWNEDAVLLQLGLKADDAVTSKGNNLVFLIDVSGSMNSSDKLPLLKTAFTFLTETLSSNDTVSIVTYAGRESVVLEGCKGTYTDQILNAVNSLGANGSTNGEAGLKKAYEIAKKYYIEGGNNRIILASDGDLNVGISSAKELEDFVSEKREEGVYLSVLGFGTGNYRDANMEAIADHGNGVYYYIDGTSEAEKVFGTDLLSTLYTVAEDVKMQITFDPRYVAQYRLVGYENRLLNEEDFEDDTKDAGEVGAGHTVTVCYELVLTEEAKSAPVYDAAKLAIRYKHPGEDVSRLEEYIVSDGTTAYDPDEDFDFICAVVQLSMLIHESEYVKDTTVDDILATLNTLSLGDDPYKIEFREMVKKLASQ